MAPLLSSADFKSPSDVADFGVLAEAFAAQLEQDASRQPQDSAVASTSGIHSHVHVGALRG